MPPPTEPRLSVLAVNVGLPREIEVNGHRVATAIYKSPVSGHVTLRRLNFDGDRQADLTVHGGPDKAVYAYPSEHYAYWRGELPGVELIWGNFGENLTITGLRENEVRIGDRYRVGTAELVVTQPRVPCYKLAIRFDRPDMPKRFLRSGRTGFYFAVRREGAVCAGAHIALLARAEHDVTVADITRLYATDRDNPDLLRRAIAVDALPVVWRDYFAQRLARVTGHAEH